MVLTFIGVIQLAVGLLIVLAGSLRSALAFLMISGLFEGSAALLLPALGGSSIPPSQFALLIVYLRILAPRGGYRGSLVDAIGANWLAVLFVAYGTVGSYLAPRIFAGQMDVYPMRSGPVRDLYYTIPLAPTSQNITAAAYLVGFLLIVLASYTVCRHRGGVQTLLNTMLFLGWLHIALGLAVMASKGTWLDGWFDMMRNGNYVQTDQAYEGFSRIRGLFPESSAFANYGFAWFVLSAELWYRSIRTRATGSLALALAAILFFSTSTTAYFGLAGYAAFFILRAIALPSTVRPDKMLYFALAMLVLAVVASILLLAMPKFSSDIVDMLIHMTLGKPNSASGEQRFFWAMQGWQAFKVSYGLGIGPGSFRSSSLIMAMLGTTGIVGISLFLAYVIDVLQPTRASTYAPSENLSWSIGGALAVAAVISLLPSAVSSAQTDPGANFGLMAGAALALRPQGRRRFHAGGKVDGK
ncbi:MAG: glycoside hydrolase [Sphingomonadales bacterium]|nr:glycoside hydrolase [Sphingomonadales bacterium]